MLLIIVGVIVVIAILISLRCAFFCCRNRNGASESDVEGSNLPIPASEQPVIRAVPQPHFQSEETNIVYEPQGYRIPVVVPTIGIIYDKYGAELNRHMVPMVWTDGCCLNNGRYNAIAGIGVFWSDNCKYNVSEPLNGWPQSSERAEVCAAVKALFQSINRGYKRLELYTDCQYIIDNMLNNVQRNRQNGWRNFSDRIVEDLRLLDILQQSLGRVYWKKVKAHIGVKGNEMADRLAREGAKSIARLDQIL